MARRLPRRAHLIGEEAVAAAFTGCATTLVVKGIEDAATLVPAIGALLDLALASC